MQSKALINNNIPELQVADTVSKALQLMADFRVAHLPVVKDHKFLGLISEEECLDQEDEKTLIGSLQPAFIQIFVRANDHFLNAVLVMNQNDMRVLPVINEKNDFEGTITICELLKALGEYAGSNELGGIIVMEIERVHYSVSELSRIVESTHHNILHLNTTPQNSSDILTVTIHLNNRELGSLVTTLQRFDYHVTYFTGNKDEKTEIEQNYHHLMNYLDI